MHVFQKRMVTRWTLITLASFVSSSILDEDFCTLVHHESVCENGRCTDMYWMDRSFVEFTLDPVGVLGGYLEQVSCGDAQAIADDRLEIPAVFHEFQVETYGETLFRNKRLLKDIEEGLERFPFESLNAGDQLVGKMTELYASLYFSVGGVPLEVRAANHMLLGSASFQSFWWRIADLSHAMALIPVTEKHMETYKKFTTFVHLFLDVESAGFAEGLAVNFHSMQEALAFMDPPYRAMAARDTRKSAYSPL